MKYLVMECRLSYAVVLDENGRFLKAANRNYAVGQTVTDIVEMQLPQTTPKASPLVAMRKQLAAIAACLVLVLTALFALGQTPYASVYLSINPEVRIDVNRSDRVIRVEGVNADGETLLEGYKPQRKSLDLVMDDLVDRAIDMGYLHQGGKITLTLDADETWKSSHTQSLTTHIQDHVPQGMTVTIDITPQTPAPETTPVQTIVIPLTPDGGDQFPAADSGYGDRSYEIPASQKDEESDYDTPAAAENKDSGYDAPDPDEDQDSSYDAPASDGDQDSGYDSPGSGEDGDSGYDPPEPSNDKDSGYDPPPAGNDKDSGYDPPPAGNDKDSGYNAPPAGNDKDSGYDAPPAGNDKDSGYDAPPAGNDKDSGYDGPSRDPGGDSGYDRPDQGASDYRRK